MPGAASREAVYYNGGKLPTLSDPSAVCNVEGSTSSPNKEVTMLLCRKSYSLQLHNAQALLNLGTTVSEHYKQWTFL